MTEAILITTVRFDLNVADHIILDFIIPRAVLLSSTQRKAETLDFSTHALPRNLLEIFPPREYEQRQRCQAIWCRCRGFSVPLVISFSTCVSDYENCKELEKLPFHHPESDCRRFSLFTINWKWKSFRAEKLLTDLENTAAHLRMYFSMIS